MPGDTPVDLNKFMVQDSDRIVDGETPEYYPVTPIHSGCSVLPLIDGEAYFENLYDEIQNMSSATAGDPSEQFIYIAAWAITLDLKLTESSPTLLELLREKAQAGVDVRILIWANDYLLDSNKTIMDFIEGAYRFWVNFSNLFRDEEIPVGTNIPYAGIQFFNLLSVHEIRELAPEIQVMVNHLDHEKGGAHMKMAIISSGGPRTVAYTGGIDLARGRRDNPLHREGDKWHDVQVKVRGPVVQEIYDVYVALWNEIMNKEEGDSPVFLLAEEFPEQYPDGFGKITAKTPENTLIDRQELSYVTTPNVNHHCQSLFTIPDSSGWFTSGSDKISFAPNGWHQVRLALKKSIKNAKDYIYIEDQAFASREIFGLLKEALQDTSRPDLKLIMVSGSTDPNDKPSALINKLDAMNDYLLKGLNDEQRSRIVLFEHYIVVHSKVWIIDDKWAMIGSANVLNRALYTEIEHCVSFMNEVNTVGLFRTDLWGEHFGIPPSERIQRLGNLQESLNVWNPDWGTLGSGIKLPCYSDSIGDIPAVTWDGVVKPCLIPASAMVHADSGSKTHITCGLLPDSSEVNITKFDLYVHINSGPNTDCIRKIINHIGKSIYFDEMTDANDSSTVFSIFRPRIDKVELPAYEGDKIGIVDSIALKSLKDYGDAP